MKNRRYYVEYEINPPLGNKIREATMEEIKQYELAELELKETQVEIDKLKEQIKKLEKRWDKYRDNKTYYPVDAYPYTEMVFLTHSDLA